MSDEGRALERIRELGGAVERDDEQPGKPIVKVDLSWKRLKDKDLEILTAFADLREVDLTQVRGISDAGLAVFKKIKALRTLDLSLTRIGDTGLKEIAGCKRLQQLNLWDTRITNAGLPALRACKQLRSLNVSQTRVSDVGVKALLALKTLEELNLGYTKITDNALALLREFENLQELDLGGLDKITATGLLELRRLTNLRSLSLCNVPIEQEWFDALKACKRLRKLDLSLVEKSDLAGVKGLTALEKLNLYGARVTKEVLAAVSALPKLKELDLSKTQIKDAWLKPLGGCKSLEELNFRETPFTGVGLKALRRLPALHRLDLSESGVTDAGAKELHDFPTLRTLWLNETKITDAGLKKLAGLPMLRTLGLSKTLITDAALEVVTRFPNLEGLYLKSTGVTDASMKPVANLLRLEHLDLSETRVGDEALRVLKSLDKLSSLTLTGTTISNTGLRPLREGFKSLQNVWLDGTRVTPSGVRLLRAARPDLDVVHDTPTDENKVRLDVSDILEETMENILEGEGDCEGKITEDMDLAEAIEIARAYPLESLLANFKSGEVTIWRSAEEVLAECPDQQTTSRMLDLLQEELEEKGNSKWFRAIELRLRTNKALPKREKELAVSTLLPLVDRKPAEGELEPVAGKALDALSQVQPLPPAVLKTCSKKLNHPHYHVASSALRVLVNLPPEQRGDWVPVLLKHFHGRFSEDGNSEGNWIIECLGPHFVSHRKQVVPVLREALQSEHAFLPGTALEVLRQLGPTAAEMVPDVLAYVGRQTAFTNEEPHLVHIDPEGIQAVPGLIRLLDSDQETVRYQAVCELEAYGPRAQAAVPALTALASPGKGKKELTADADAAREAVKVIQQAPDAEAPKSAMERALDLVKKAAEGE